MKSYILSSVWLCCCLCFMQAGYAQYTEFCPGQVWNDTDGNPINAHGGGMLYHEGIYYWYGEYKKGKTVLLDGMGWECYRTDVSGVSCYSSKDLLNWKFEGIVLPAVKDDSGHDLHPSKVLERPKVIYNKKTGKFVMWAHVESADYSKACAGVAISDSPTGEFKYLGSFRPNGEMSRDQTVFVDDDGRAYQIYSSEGNATMYISLLTEDYLDIFRLYGVGSERGGDSRGRFRHGRMDGDRQSVYGKGCLQDILWAEHLRAAGHREKGCLYRHVRPLEQDRPGTFTIYMASRNHRRGENYNSLAR